MAQRLCVMLRRRLLTGVAFFLCGSLCSTATQIDTNFVTESFTGVAGIFAGNDGKVFVISDRLTVLNENGSTASASAKFGAGAATTAIRMTNGTFVVAQANELRMYNAQGSLVPDFAPPPLLRYVSSDRWIRPGVILCMVEAPGGRIWVGGRFDLMGTNELSSLVQLDAQGQLRSQVNVGPNNWQFEPTVYALAVESTGDLLVGGNYAHAQEFFSPGLARVTRRGFVDRTFQPQFSADFTDLIILGLGTQADGKILVSGTFSMSEGREQPSFARLERSGALDTGFVPGTTPGVLGRSMIEGEDGLFVIGTTDGLGLRSNRIRKFLRNGADDFSVTTFSNAVSAAALDSVGRLLVGSGTGPLLRLLAHGPAGAPVITQEPRMVEILEGEHFTLSAKATAAKPFTVYWEKDGVPIPSPGSHFGVFSAAPEQTGVYRLVVSNQFGVATGPPQDVRITPREPVPFELDPSFTARPGVYPKGMHYDFTGIQSFQSIREVKADSRGRLYIQGAFTGVSGYSAPGVARLESSGALDRTFRPGPFIFEEGWVYISRINISPDKRIFISGSFTNYAGVAVGSLIALREDGSRDNTFACDLNGVQDFCFTGSDEIVTLTLRSITDVPSLSWLGMDGVVLRRVRLPITPYATNIYAFPSNPGTRHLLALPNGRVVTKLYNLTTGLIEMKAWDTNGIEQVEFAANMGSLRPHDMEMDPRMGIYVTGSYWHFGLNQVMLFGWDGRYKRSYSLSEEAAPDEHGFLTGIYGKSFLRNDPRGRVHDGNAREIGLEGVWDLEIPPGGGSVYAAGHMYRASNTLRGGIARFQLPPAPPYLHGPSIDVDGLFSAKLLSNRDSRYRIYGNEELSSGAWELMGEARSTNDVLLLPRIPEAKRFFRAEKLADE